MTADAMLGPIRAKHARDGWQLDHAGTGWALTKRIRALTARVYATTAATCSWSVYYDNGCMLREVSWGDVEEAKALADKWIQDYLS